MKILTDYSPAEQAALRNEICADATDDQINYFLRVCHARSVDPFSNLLYMQRRFNSKTQKWKCSISPTADGSRAAAARTGEYAGSDEPEFDSEEGEQPKWCRVTVYRKVDDLRCAFTAKIRWKEFVPNAPNDFQWKAKPYHMLGKCAEIQALRKAFPESVPATGEDEYCDEIETGTPAVAPDPAAQEKTALAVEWNNALKAFASLGKKEADLLAHVKVENATLVTRQSMDDLRTWYDVLARDK